MAPHGNLALPQGNGIRDRVLSKASATTGHLEDQTLDLDARTMAIMGKRQRLSVSRTPYFQLRCRTISLILKRAAGLWNDFTSCFFHDFTRLLGVICMV